jgi:hypothetical protein
MMRWSAAWPPDWSFPGSCQGATSLFGTRSWWASVSLNDPWPGVNQRLRDIQAEIDTHPPLTNNLLRESWQNLLARKRQLRYEYNELNTQVTLRYRRLVPD